MATGAYFEKFINPHGPVISHQNDGAATHEVIRCLVEIREGTIFRPNNMIKTIRTEPGSTIRHAHWYMEHFGTTDTRSPWYPFSTPTNSGGDEIDTFLNNIVVFEGDENPDFDSQSGGFPGTIDGNAWVGSVAEANIPRHQRRVCRHGENRPRSEQPTSPCRAPARRATSARRCQAASRTRSPIPVPNDDAGPFPFGFNPGANWPRPETLTFKLDELPSRWTSPGA